MAHVRPGRAGRAPTPGLTFARQECAGTTAKSGLNGCTETPLVEDRPAPPLARRRDRRARGLPLLPAADELFAGPPRPRQFRLRAPDAEGPAGAARTAPRRADDHGHARPRGAPTRLRQARGAAVHRQGHPGVARGAPRAATAARLTTSIDEMDDRSAVARQLG